MENVLLFGIGGTGSAAVDRFLGRFLAENHAEESPVFAIVFDMDASDLHRIQNATPIPLSHARTVGTVCEALGREALEDWFPIAKEGGRPFPFSSQFLHSGSDQWRKKGFLALNAALMDPVRRIALHNALDKWVERGGPYRIVVVSSLAGGTGAGCLLPLTLYIKRYLHLTAGLSAPTSALLVCPRIYTHSACDRGITVRAHANAYATLRELHAIETVATHSRGYGDVHFRLGNNRLPTGTLFDSDRREYHTPQSSPFEQVWLFDRLSSCETVSEHEAALSAAIDSLLHGAPAIAFRQSSPLYRRNRGGVFGGIGSARVEFPIDEVLNYAIRETATDLVCEEISAAQAAEDASPDSPEIETGIERYIGRLQAKAESIDFGLDSCRALAEALPPSLRKPPLFFPREAQRHNRESLAKRLPQILDLFRDCCEGNAAHRAVLSLADRILSPTPAEEDMECSLVFRLLREEGEQISCAATLNCISRLRSHLESRIQTLEKENERAWKPQGDTSPVEWLTQGDRAVLPRYLSAGSLYARERRTDFPRCLLSIADTEGYAQTRTNAYADALQCYQDVIASLHRLERAQRRYAVIALFKELSSRLASWAESYRQFLDALKQIRESLTDRAKTDRFRATRDFGNILFFGASEEQRERILRRIWEDSWSRDSGHLLLREEALRFACRDREEPLPAESLAGKLHDALRRSISQTSACAALRAESILEMIAEGEKERTPEGILGAFSRILHRLKTLAAPTVKTHPSKENEGAFSLVLMSPETAAFLHGNATYLGLSPFSPLTAAESLLSACGMENAEVILSDTVSRHCLTVTSLRDGLAPSLLADFSESSPASGIDTSYLCYREAISHAEEQADFAGGMWNPHLGNDLHKSGHLPYLDPEYVPSDREGAHP